MESTDRPRNAAAAAYLRKPYARLLIPEADGTYRAEILEFPGCIATGDTPDEAFRNLEGAADSWLQAAIAAGQNIPDPADSNEFSGRLVLRMPRSLHKKAWFLAERDGVSLNQFIMAGLAEYVGERRAHPHNIMINIAQHAANTAFSPGVVAPDSNRLVVTDLKPMSIPGTPRNQLSLLKMG